MSDKLEDIIIEDITHNDVEIEAAIDEDDTEIDISYEDAYVDEQCASEDTKDTEENTNYAENIDISELSKAENEDISLKRRAIKEIWSWIKMITFAGLTALFISYYIIINATVPTSSMENTILAKSRILGLRIAYLFSEPDRGDVVVFKYPLDEDENYVKRIIGLPGETVEIVNGEIYIYKDGELIDGPLYEPYLKEEVRDTKKYVFEIPEDRYLMLGDNRNYSADARRWLEYVENYPEKYGTDTDIIYVHKDKILGKVYFMYWYDGFDFRWIDGENVDY